MITQSLYKYAISFFFLAMLIAVAGCSKEELADKSVVDQYLPRQSHTELNQWINETFAPYNIDVLYLWKKQNLPAGSVATPPAVKRVRPALEAIRDLWLRLYEQPKAGGKDFLKDKGLLRLTLLGGNELQSSGVLLKLWYPEAASNEMFVFDVNSFEPTNKRSVYKLMRSVHHQFARRLAEHIPYDRDAFGSISPQSYGSLGLPPNQAEAQERIGLSPYAHRRGFYTLHSMYAPEDEFAEIISTMLLHTAVELDAAEQTALRPIDPTNPKEVEQAKEAYRMMRAKRAFVEAYFKEKVGISLSRLQILSLKQLNAYYTEHQTK